MMNLQFIPLKTSDGQVLGHARVRDGLVSVHAPGAQGAQALLLTDGGYVTGEAAARLRAGGNVQAVALHHRGTLVCCGFARESPYLLEDVYARLMTLYRPIEDAPQNPAKPDRPPLAPATASESAAPARETTFEAPAQPSDAARRSMTNAQEHPQAREINAGPGASNGTRQTPADPGKASARETEFAASQETAFITEARRAQNRSYARKIPAEPLIIDRDGRVADTAPASCAPQRDSDAVAASLQPDVAKPATAKGDNPASPAWTAGAFERYGDVAAMPEFDMPVGGMEQTENRWIGQAAQISGASSRPSADNAETASIAADAPYETVAAEPRRESMRSDTVGEKAASIAADALYETVAAEPRREAMRSDTVGEKTASIAADALYETVATEPRRDEAQPDAEADGGDDRDAEFDVRRTLALLRNEAAAAFIPAGSAGAYSEPESAEDSAMRAESFAALLTRCDRIFRKIEAAPDGEAARGAFEPGSNRPFAAPENASFRPAGWGEAHVPPQNARGGVLNPFPHIFPGAQFARECDAAGTELLIGHWARGAEHFTITAVRGEYSPRPPEHLPGFTRYIRTRQGGFWVRVEE